MKSRMILIIAVALLAVIAQYAADDGGNGFPLGASPSPNPAANPAAAIRMGKALFWDEQTGGDGRIACATCHFHNGADNRTLNTINPGANGKFDVVGDAGQVFTPRTFSPQFDDIVGSQGIVGSLFVSVNSNADAADTCTPNETAPFFHNRRVTGRNTPPMIGATFNRQNFWDGRANDNFNGNDPFGNTGNQLGAVGAVVPFSSLASQAVGPPNNPTEMSCEGRPFNGPNSLAVKMLARQALKLQVVDPNDSVLGAYRASPTGLTKTYAQLAADAYGTGVVTTDNFSRFWGLAVQAYVSTLIPNQTPLDKFMAGNSSALTNNQQRGLGVFSGKGQCSKCHAGPELTDASVNFAARRGLINEDGGDQGFHNNGVRPTAEDLGRAGKGPNGVSFSQSGSKFDRGAFKTPGLRNVNLTAPYFHNGGKATLAAVVDLYDRGGDFANPEKAKRIKELGLGSSDKANLVDFLTNGLTDCRTANEQAPFDHPSLNLPNNDGHPPVLATGGVHTCP